MSGSARKRPWFQFHLSTAIVLMFVAGGVLSANTQVGLKLEYSHQNERFESYEIRYIVGWPAEMYAGSAGYGMGPPGSGLKKFNEMKPPSIAEIAEWPNLEPTGWNVKGLCLNSVAFIFCLIAIAFILEWWIRRKVAKPCASGAGSI